MKKILRDIKHGIKNVFDKRIVVKTLSLEMWGGQTGAEVILLLLAHSLEKGLGIPSPRKKFGLGKATALLNELEAYVVNGGNIYRYAFSESVGILDAYFKYTDNDISEYTGRINALKKLRVEKYEAGIKKINNIQELYRQVNIEQVKKFICTRHSIRSYEQEIINEDLLNKILELASYAPSACNRQPVKVYWASEINIINKISELIPGNTGFENEIPNWAIITTDRNMFGAGETLQWYINGGIYLAYFVEALHAYHIGSCIFQIPATHKNTTELRRIMKIPKQEAIIAAVGFGYPKNENKVLVASRRPIRETKIKCE